MQGVERGVVRLLLIVFATLMANMLLGCWKKDLNWRPKSMLMRLHVRGIDKLPGGEPRTLQRRVRVWRKRIVRQFGRHPAFADSR